MDIQTAAPTQITVYPNPQAESGSDWRNQPLTRRHMADRYRGQEMAGSDAEKAMFGEDGLQVSDVLDVLNPLQHIPFVSTLYREMTGDTISTAAKLAGGAVLGGPIGFVAAIFDTIFEAETGKNVAGSVFAALTGEPTSPPSTQLASASTPSSAPGQSDAEWTEVASTNNAVNEAEQAIKTAQYQRQAEEITLAQAEILPPPGSGSAATMSSTQASEVLGLYGGSVPPAQAAYRQANMLGYLQSASTNIVM